jgi:hypothetical protein
MSVIVIQAGGGVKHLAGKEPVGQGQRNCVLDKLPVGIVDDVAHFIALGIYDQAGRAEVVAEGVVQVVVYTGGESLTVGVVVLGDRRDGSGNGGGAQAEVMAIYKLFTNS